MSSHADEFIAQHFAKAISSGGAYAASVGGVFVVLRGRGASSVRVVSVMVVLRVFGRAWGKVGDRDLPLPLVAFGLAPRPRGS